MSIINKKYELLTLKTHTIEREDGTQLHRIRAIQDFGLIKKGELGGYVQSEDNLSHEGNCWVSGNTRIYGNAWVYADAQVWGNAQVGGNTRVFGNARVQGNARIQGDAWVTKCLHFQQFRNSITATNTHVFIGCEGHTWDYWTKNIEEIGQKHGYSQQEIEDVRVLFQILKRQLGITE